MTINDTLPIYWKFFCSKACLCVQLMVAGLCLAARGEPQRVKAYTSEHSEVMQGLYLRTADLLVKRAEFRVFNVSKAIHGFKMSLLYGSLSERAIQQIDELAISVDPAAHDVLDGLVEYCKALLVAHCLRSAYAKSLEAGEEIFPALDVFSKLFAVQDSSVGIYREDPVQHQVDFIKASMSVLGGLRATGWRESFFRSSVKKTDALLDRFDGALPACCGSDQHNALTCHRCCALRVFFAINEEVEESCLLSGRLRGALLSKKALVGVGFFALIVVAAAIISDL